MRPTPGCIMGRRQVSGGSVMLGEMFCWGPPGPAISVAVDMV